MKYVKLKFICLQNAEVHIVHIVYGHSAEFYKTPKIQVLITGYGGTQFGNVFPGVIRPLNEYAC